MKEIKKRLYEICMEYVEDRIRNAESAISTARESANDDTKSSAGDKYETTREMMQQEIDRNRKQLDESMKLKLILNQIDPAKSSDLVEQGSLVHTNLGIFYISISKGQISVDGKTYFAISSVSPIGQLLMRKKKGAEAVFNGKAIKVQELY